MIDTKQQPDGHTPLKQLFYSLDEAAKMLSVKRGKVYLMLKEGELRSAKIGRRTVIAASELERYAAQICGTV